MALLPKVQIFCTTYKHEQFIEEALESFLAQKTNFPFEIIVADDASPDKTTDIIRAYQRKYPDIIKPIFRTVNTGGDRNFREAANALTAEYVAWCEGDDYWTDDKKLQKQVDALEAHPECAICFHPVMVKWEDKSREDVVFPDLEFRFNKSMLDIEDLLIHNFIQTNSVVYRWRFRNDSFLRTFPEDILPGDWFLHLLHADKGTILFLDECMAVYRKWAGGLWAGAGISDEWFCRCGVKHMRFFQCVDRHFHDAKNKISFEELSHFASRIIASAKRLNQQTVLDDLLSEFSSYCVDEYIQPHERLDGKMHCCASMGYRVSSYIKCILSFCLSKVMPKTGKS